MNTIENAVAGKRYVSSGRRVPVFNPATGEVSAELPLSTMSELNDAVASAKKAQVAWGNTPPMKRAVAGETGEEIARASALAINGIAGGLRNTG